LNSHITTFVVQNYFRLFVRYFLICSIIISALLISSCSSGSEKHGRWNERKNDELLQMKKQEARRNLIPPWQTWSIRENYGVKEFATAQELVEQGKFPEAVAQYQEVEKYGISGPVKQEAFVRRVSTMLMFGASQTALQAISEQVKNNGMTEAEIDPRLALVTAFAYYHLNDLDQSFAWLGVANRNSSKGESTKKKSVAATNAIVASISSADLENFKARWAGDPFIGPIITKERLNRTLGNRPVTPDSNLSVWFDAGYYAGEGSSSTFSPPVNTALPPQQLNTSGGEFVVGVLLPFTGQYAEHAQKVKHGIEYALSELPGDAQVRLVLGDTQANPVTAANEYERLVTQEKVKVVLGPLLYETSVSVAQKSLTLGVPFITFTKRSGVPNLSPATFRLGVTSEDQVSELVQYARGSLGVSRFALLYPSDPNGDEFRDLSLQMFAQSGAEVVYQSPYQPGAVDYSMTVSPLAAAKPQALFVPDALDKASLIIQAAKNTGLTDTLLIGPAAWDDPIAIRGYGQLLEGAIFVSAFYPFSVRGHVGTFVEGFRQTYGNTPDVLAAQAYDAAKIAFSAADSADSATVIQKLHLVDNYSGATGALSVSANGEITRRMTVLKVEHGELVEVVSAGQTIGFVPNEQAQAQQVAN